MFGQRTRRLRWRKEPRSPFQVDGLLARAVESGSVRRAATAAAGTAAFRASVEQRLKTLESDLVEVKGRLNGLLFLVAGAVVTQLVLHIFHI
jgi:uncharacterized protein YceH (UPF0502 family)